MQPALRFQLSGVTRPVWSRTKRERNSRPSDPLGFEGLLCGGSSSRETIPEHGDKERNVS